MDCPNCGTWNPDDKIRCFRCNTELPKPPEPKKPRQPASQMWIWVVAALFLVASLLVQCGIIRIGGSGEDVGALLRLLPMV